MSEQYIRPCEQDGISDDYWDHVARGSVNPGLDYVCAWGDQAWASKTGTVASISNSIGGSGGRYILIDWDDGTESYYLHLSSIEVVRGQRVAQHEDVAKTGASGFGSEFGYGAHLHFTIRINGANVDPLPLVVPPTGSGWASAGGSTPIPSKTPYELELEYLVTVADDIVADIKGDLKATLAAMETRIVDNVNTHIAMFATQTIDKLDGTTLRSDPEQVYTTTKGAQVRGTGSILFIPEAGGKGIVFPDPGAFELYRSRGMIDPDVQNVPINEFNAYARANGLTEDIGAPA